MTYVKPWCSVDDGAKLIDCIAIEGRTSFVNWGCYLKGVTIGKGVLISPNVTMTSASHPVAKGKHIKDQKTVQKPIIIGDGVLIGAGATILGGCIIRDGAVIGAGCVLLEDTEVGENEIWVGNPGRLLRSRK